MRLDIRKLFQNFLVFFGAVGIPAYLIQYSNKHVFPSTLTMANGMLAITVIASIGAMLAASDERADDRVRGFAILGKIVIGGILWWNIGGHWQLSREYDAAQAGVRETHEEQRLQDEREKKRTDREKELAAARAQEAQALAVLEKNQAINRDAATRQCRLTGNCGGRSTAPQTRIPLPVPTSVVSEPALSLTPIKARRTPDEVREEWNPTLTTRAYAEAGAGIFVLIILMALWHLDFDGNGIPDRVQRLRPEIVQRQYPEWYERIFGRPLPDHQPAHLPGN